MAYYDNGNARRPVADEHPALFGINGWIDDDDIGDNRLKVRIDFRNRISPIYLMPLVTELQVQTHCEHNIIIDCQDQRHDQLHLPTLVSFVVYAKLAGFGIGCD